MAEDPLAQDMAKTALFAWGNLVATLVQTMREADVPNSLIHGVLDRLQDANNTVLSSKGGKDLLQEMVDGARAGLPSND